MKKATETKVSFYFRFLQFPSNQTENHTKPLKPLLENPRNQLIQANKSHLNFQQYFRFRQFLGNQTVKREIKFPKSLSKFEETTQTSKLIALKLPLSH